ncbi:MAG: hypothetical protein ACI3W5_05755 [Faecousia sp.]
MDANECAEALRAEIRHREKIINDLYIAGKKFNPEKDLTMEMLRKALEIVEKAAQAGEK